MEINVHRYEDAIKVIDAVQKKYLKKGGFDRSGHVIKIRGAAARCLKALDHAKIQFTYTERQAWTIIKRAIELDLGDDYFTICGQLCQGLCRALRVMFDENQIDRLTWYSMDSKIGNNGSYRWPCGAHASRLAFVKGVLDGLQIRRLGD